MPAVSSRGLALRGALLALAVRGLRADDSARAEREEEALFGRLDLLVFADFFAAAARDFFFLGMVDGLSGS